MGRITLNNILDINLMRVLYPYIKMSDNNLLDINLIMF